MEGLHTSTGTRTVPVHTALENLKNNSRMRLIADLLRSMFPIESRQHLFGRWWKRKHPPLARRKEILSGEFPANQDWRQISDARVSFAFRCCSRHLCCYCCWWSCPPFTLFGLGVEKRIWRIFSSGRKLSARWNSSSLAKTIVVALLEGTPLLVLMPALHHRRNRGSEKAPSELPHVLESVRKGTPEMQQRSELIFGFRMGTGVITPPRDFLRSHPLGGARLGATASGFKNIVLEPQK